MRTSLCLIAKASLLAATLAAPAVATAPAASARCLEAGQTYYTISNVVVSRRLSNLRSDWVAPGMSISYSVSKTATAQASITGTASLEAGAIFAKASTSIGVTVGGSWSRAQTWTYSATNRSRTRDARLVMYHGSRKFLVRKKRVSPTCTIQTLYSTTVNAPRKAGSNYWRLQYRKH